MRKGGVLKERIHVQMMSHGQWEVMEEWREEDEMMRVNLADDEDVGL